ncbi:hypothetical protein BAOM_4602 [Peribacillus asahii]|uniref:Helix-turn-helix domain-containing protein n=1 Tax=Peribacillus asahii TaxID=228899 RepID=A0A3T0KXZ6_9BACI|nr:helix-turn-helix domain-containing protein [Peribacillus asahii]AZV45181.1 hypothetical protein BAOM_4602 [Peribacillus asahii]
MMTRKVFNKRTPAEGGKNFIALPNDACHYVHHEKMSADKLFLYALIIDYYNLEEGFAFPSIETLAVAYGKAPDTTSKHIDDLKAVGLIDFPYKGRYVPLIPLSATEFYAEFPEAFTNYQTAFRRCETRKADSRERARLWREKYAD